MSTSQFKSFQKCESAALAELNGEYERERSDALLFGSYIDSFFEGTLDQFEEANPELFSSKGKTKGELKSAFKHAEYVIERIKRDRLFSLMMSGKKQVIKLGEIAGIPFKIKIDSLLDSDVCNQIVKEFPETSDWFGFCDGAIVDLKVMQNLDSQWSDEDGTRLPFVEFWGYDIQAATYQAIEGNSLPFFLAVATKEKEPNIQILSVPQEVLDNKLYEVKHNIKRFDSIKKGLTEPTSCGVCPYCRRNKILTTIIDYREVE